ncbi:hypothetical protein GYMLUDRAFT_165891 [Collybiopsis luxurians FD-317 M1]|uniref:PX domain-containing protein n=1 Tax=Collybiopsis luxurians FD-317 M1 TaxID=944289 RepID=A0A0D0CGM2_9AGAR|nr:hypothetical protein GYMLUDRAFT_165891 [Collybiopsis luxurians FD-317 M1]
MDGFDDLLAPSRSILEDNPFSEDNNPFGSSDRSGSPDPWASPFGHQDAWGDEHSTQTTAVDYHQPESPVAPPFSPTSTESAPEETESETAEPGDPLDSAAANAISSDEEDNKPLGYKRASLQKFTASKENEAAGSEEQVVKDERHGEPKREEEAEDKDRSEREEKAGRQSRPESPLVFSETATIRPNMIEEPERHPTPPTVTSSISSISGPSSPAAAWGGPLSSPIAGGWGEHEETYDGGAMSASAPVVSKAQEEDDSDDDKPLAQSLSTSPQKQNQSAARSLSTRDDLPPLFTITVDDPQKVGDPIRPYVMYTVHTRTTSPLFQKSAFSVLRRYSDFLWLYNTLSYNNPGVVVPPVPEKNPLLFTNPILGSAGKKGYIGRFDEGFIRQRRFALEKCIQKIANHPVLCKDPDLKMFLESDTFALDIKHRKPDPGSPGPSGGFISSIGQTIASATGSRFHETDEYFESKKAYLDSLESQLRSLVKSINVVSKHRLEVAQAVSEFSDRVKDLAEGTQPHHLSQALAGLAEVERKSQELHVLQSEQDMITIMGTVDEYARLIGRRMYQAWKNADADVIRVKQNHERNRNTSAYGGNSPNPASGTLSRGAGGAMGHSLSQIAEAEMRASQAKRAFDNTSRLCKSEMARFEEERVEDFRNALHAWLEGMIGRQTELIAAWEGYQQGLLRSSAGAGRGGAAQNGRGVPIST